MHQDIFDPQMKVLQAEIRRLFWISEELKEVCPPREQRMKQGDVLINTEVVSHSNIGIAGDIRGGAGVPRMLELQ